LLLIDSIASDSEFKHSTLVPVERTYNSLMANHFQEIDCEVCGKLYRIGWNQPMESSLIEVVPVTISHCPMGKPIRTVGITSFEELLDGQWVAVEPYVHKKNIAAA